jgi:hypothetical protein
MTSIMPTTALTYEELAARTGMSIASARRLVHRRKWRKAKGNDGRAVVQVPDEFLEHHQGKHRDSHDGSHHDAPSESHNGASALRTDPSAMMADIMARLAAAQDDVVGMARKLGAADSEIAALKTQVDEAYEARDDARAERDRWSIQADQLVATVNPLKNTIEALKAALDAERGRISELREERDRWRTAANARRSWWPWRRSA